MKIEKVIELLYAALAEPVGILLQVSDPEKARAKLHEAKAAARDPDLLRLQFRLSPLAGGNLLIVKGTLQPEGAGLRQVEGKSPSAKSVLDF